MIGCFLIVLVLMGFFWDKLYLNKLNFNSFTGHLIENVGTISMQTSAGADITTAQYYNKYLVLYCWYSECSICFDGFPIVESLFRNYQDDNLVQIMGLHWGNI